MTKITSQSTLLPAWSQRSFLMLACAILPVLIASIVGARLTAPALLDWYPTLIKPSFTPPNLTFPIVWTLLYTLMAFAFWRILRRGGVLSQAHRQSIIWFAAQIVLNVAWSYTFFTLRSPILGLLVIGMLFLSIAWMIRNFLTLDKLAGFSQIPYLLWVGFAALLNATIVVLNVRAGY